RFANAVLSWLQQPYRTQIIVQLRHDIVIGHLMRLDPRVVDMLLVQPHRLIFHAEQVRIDAQRLPLADLDDDYRPLADGYGYDAKLFVQLADRRLARRLVLADVPGDKAPLAGVAPTGIGAAEQQHLAVGPLHNRRRDLTRGMHAHWPARSLYGRPPAHLCAFRGTLPPRE